MKQIKLDVPIVVLLLALLLNSCSNNTKQQTTPTSPDYFDLKVYFEAEAARLEKADPTVLKTVSIDGSSEEKELIIDDWTKELSAFGEADINKAAWKGQFSFHKKAGFEYYKAKDKDIPVRLLAIKRDGEIITGIEITMSNDNALYHSEDKLSYYPDSLYEVSKTQIIRFKDPKNYEVRGIFRNAVRPLPAQSSAAPLQ